MKLNKKKLQTLVAFCSIAVAPVIAEESVITEHDLFAEIDTVSGVIHMRQTLQQVPAAVTIIDRQTIEASAAVDVVDLFRLVPGFQVYFHHANKPGVAYHALGGEYSRRLEVKVDGRSVYESILSSVEWSTLGISLDDIDYIEVVRGSNAPADGSNAFLASINIVTRSALMQDGARARFDIGNQGIRNNSFSLSGTTGSMQHNISLQSRRNDGFADFAGIYNGQDTTVTVDDGAKTKSLRYRGLWTPNASDSLVLQLGMGDTDTTNSPKDYETRLFDASYQHLRWKHIGNNWSDIEFVLYHNSIDLEDQADEMKFQDAYGIMYAKDLELHGDGVADGTTVRASFLQSLKGLEESQKNDLFNALGLGALGMPNFDYALDYVGGQLQPASSCDLSDPASCSFTEYESGLVMALPNNTVRASEGRHFSDRWDAELRGNFYHWDSLRIGLGLAARYDSSTSELFFGSPDKISQTAYRTYANLEWTASDKITLNSGLITEKVEQGGSNTSYRAAANYQLAEQQTIRLAANHAYRAPTMLERLHSTDYKYNENITLDLSVKPDPNIVAEQLSSYEIGYGGSFLDRSLLLDVRIFKEDFSDIIDQTRRDSADFGIAFDYDRQVNIYTNAASLQVRGIEWQLQYRPTDNILLHANHSYADVEGTTVYSLSPERIELPLKDSTPDNILTFMGSYTSPGGVRWGATYYYKSAYLSKIRKTLVGGDIDLSHLTKPFSRVDLTAAKKWQLGKHSMELSFTVQNVGDDYQEHHYFNRFNSKYILGLKLGSN